MTTGACPDADRARNLGDRDISHAHHFRTGTDDVARFHDALRRAERLAADMDECDIVDAANSPGHLPLASTAGLRAQAPEVQRLILMLEDEDWALHGAERDDVLRAQIVLQRS